MTSRDCTKCKRHLPAASFHKKGDGIAPRCKECVKRDRSGPEYRARVNAYDRARYAANPTEKAIKNKAYQRRNPEKFRKYSSDYIERTGGTPATPREARVGTPLYLREGRYFDTSVRDLRRLRGRQGGGCAHCGARLGGSPHLDHIIPLTRGGRHSIGNVQFLCAGCNQQKGDRLYADFRYMI